MSGMDFGPLSSSGGYTDDPALLAALEVVQQHAVPLDPDRLPRADLPTVDRSTASAFMRGRRPIPPNLERAVKASNAAGLPAEAIAIDGLVLLLVVERDGGVRLQTALADPAEVAYTLRMVADEIEAGGISGERVVPDGRGDRG